MTNKQTFYEQIKNTFFTDITINFELFNETIRSALPIFGELEVDIFPKESGGKTLLFFDVDETQIVLAPEGVNPMDLDTHMSTKVLTLHLDEEDIIAIVEHDFSTFTPTNKENVLLFASLIGKKMDF